MIRLVIMGVPVPQPRPQISTHGGFGRAYVPAKHPIHHYRRSIQSAAMIAASQLRWQTEFPGSVDVRVWWHFQRPPSHYRAGGRLREDALAEPRADVDNLLKGVLDALMEAWAFGDDVMVRSSRLTKRFVSPRIKPHTVIEIRARGARRASA